MPLHWWAFYHYNFTLISCLLLRSLVSLSWRVMELNSIVNFPLFRQERVNHLWGIPQAAFIKCLNTWCILTGSASGRGCRFFFRTFFILYISQLSPHSSYFIVNPKRELVTPRTLLLSSYTFRWDRHFFRDRLLGKSPLPSTFHFCLLVLVDRITF